MATGNQKMMDFYEQLGLTDRRCNQEEIKVAYKKAALKWHPDRNIGNEEAATFRFKEVRHAYSVLSDVNERAWYDSHRDQILSGDNSGDFSDEEDEVSTRGGVPQPKRRPPQGPNVMNYFVRSVYKDYDDSSNGFYTIFHALFNEIDEVERRWFEQDHSHKTYEPTPKFGQSNASTNEVNFFYTYWCSFVSVRSFAECDRYNPNDADGRRMRRAMEAENTRYRKQERTKFQGDIRHLAQHLRKRDPRVAEINQRLKEEEEAKDAKKREAKALKAAEYAKLKAEWKEDILKSYEEAAEAEANYSGPIRLADDDYGDLYGDSDKKYKKGKKTKRKGNKKKSVDDVVESGEGSSSSDAPAIATSDTVTATVGDGVSPVVDETKDKIKSETPVTETAIDDDSDEDSDDDNDSEEEESSEEEEEEEIVSWKCELCKKEFKSQSQFDNHEKSKAHKKKVADFILEEERQEQILKKMKKKTFKKNENKKGIDDGLVDDMDEYELSETSYHSSDFESAEGEEGEEESDAEAVSNPDKKEEEEETGGGGDDDDDHSSTSSFDDTCLLEGNLKAEEESDEEDEFMKRFGSKKLTKKEKKKLKKQRELDEFNESNKDAVPVSDSDVSVSGISGASEVTKENDDAMKDDAKETENNNSGDSTTTAATTDEGNASNIVDKPEEEEYEIIDTSKSTKPTKKNKKGKNTGGDGGGVGGGHPCRGCGLVFLSNTALFKHLEVTGHATKSGNNEDHPKKQVNTSKKSAGLKKKKK